MSASYSMSSSARPADEPHAPKVSGAATSPGASTADSRRLEARLAAEAPALRAFLRRIAGHGASREEADDLAQDAIARALRYRDAYDESRPIASWLRGIALRVLLDHRERRSRAPAAVDGDGHEAVSPTDHTVEHRDALERLLAPLSSVERDVLVRFHAHGEEVLEIARALELPEGTVKSHLHRARRKLARRHPRGEDA